MRQFVQGLNCIIHLSLVCGVYGFVIINNPSSYVALSATPKKSNNDPISNIVKRKEWEDDLNESGGDPAFLPEGFTEEEEWYDDAVVDEVDETMPSMTLLGMAGASSVLDRYSSGDNGDGEEGEQEEEEENDDGSKPDFEWDGVERDDAYFLD